MIDDKFEGKKVKYFSLYYLQCIKNSYIYFAFQKTRKKRNMDRYARRWPKSIVPYDFHPSFSK